MPDYDLGKAHGEVKIDYDKSGIGQAKRDIKDLGDETETASKKIVSSTGLTEDQYKALAGAVKSLQSDVDRATSADIAAKARQEAAEKSLNAVRSNSASTARQIRDAENEYKKAVDRSVVSSGKLKSAMDTLTRAKANLGTRKIDIDVPDEEVVGRLRRISNSLDDIDKSAKKGVSGLNTFTGRLGAMGTIASVAAPEVAGLAVSLVQLAGLAGVAAGGVAALGAVGATVKVGLSGVADAIKAQEKGGKAAAEAMKNLSPQAQAFVKQTSALSKEWDKVKFAVQDALFKNLAPALKQVASTYLPIVKTGMSGIATELNGLVIRTKQFLLQAQTTKDVQSIFANTKSAVHNLGPALTAILQILRDVATVGSTFLPNLASNFSKSATAAADFVAKARDSGKLREWMQAGLDTAKDLWTILKNLVSIVVNVFSSFDQQGGGALKTLAGLTTKLKEFLDSAKGQEFLKELGKTLAMIGGAVGVVFMSLLEKLVPIFTALAPLIQEVTKILAGGMLIAIQAIAPVLQVVADVLGFLAPVLGPVIAAFILFEKAIVIIRTAMLALNIVLAVNPFIAIATAIIALVIIIVSNWDAIKAALVAAWEWIKSTAETVWNAIKDFFVGLWFDIANFFIGVWNGIAEFLNTTFDNIGKFFTDTWTSIKEFFESIWNGIADFFTSIWDGITSTVENAWNWIKNLFNNALDTIVTWVQDGLRNIGQFFADLPGNILRALGSLGSLLLSAGRDLVQGLVDGIGNAAGWVWDKLVGIVKSAWNGVLNFLGIHSPAREAIWAMEMLGKGLVIGLDSQKNKVASAAQTLADSAAVAVDGTVAMGVGIDAASAAGSVLAATASTSAAASTPSAGSRGGATITIGQLVLQVSGSLDDSNPMEFRKTIVKIKDAIRTVERQYS